MAHINFVSHGQKCVLLEGYHYRLVIICITGQEALALVFEDFTEFGSLHHSIEAAYDYMYMLKEHGLVLLEVLY